MTINYVWRGASENDELNALHGEAFGHDLLDDDWVSQVTNHSLGWVCARADRRLVGFVNVVWDGGTHAFILDTLVVGAARHQGIGVQLIEVAAREALAAGCEWLPDASGCTLTSTTGSSPSTLTPAGSAP